MERGGGRRKHGAFSGIDGPFTIITQAPNDLGKNRCATIYPVALANRWYFVTVNMEAKKTDNNQN